MTAIRSREEVWKTEAAKHPEGYVFCNLCGNRVLPGDDWDRSHNAEAPRCFGGSVVGVGHRRCNTKNNIEYVIPAAAEARNRFNRHVGITGPGLGRNPMVAGRRSGITKKISGEVEPRMPRYGKHARAMARLHGPNWRPE